MSKKKNKHLANQPATKQEISIQDDPYWRVSHLNMDPHRVGKYIIKFDKLDEEYPEWAGMLLDGIPTFYGILGVERGASEENVEKAYMNKLELSHYSRSILEEAYDVLSSETLQKKYDELLFVFEQITKCMLVPDKNELIRNHSMNLTIEKDFVRMRDIQKQYKNFLNLYLFGAPELYELIGIGKDSSQEDIKRQCETGSELRKRIYSILGAPVKREEYDFMMNFIQKYAHKEHHEHRNIRLKNWENMDRNLLEKLMLNALDNSDETEQLKKRMYGTLTNNQDWSRYLSPNKETFFSILGLDRNLLSGDKKEIETMIREKYRHLEKTPEVNLAYTVLKNESQRADYLCLIENIEFINTMQRIFSDDMNEKTPGKSKKEKKGKRQAGAAKKKTSMQITFEDLEKALEIIESEVKRLRR